MKKLNKLLGEKDQTNCTLKATNKDIQEELKPYIKSVLKVYSNTYIEGMDCDSIVSGLKHLYDARIAQEDVVKSLDKLANEKEGLKLHQGAYFLKDKDFKVLKEEIKL